MSQLPFASVPSGLLARHAALVKTVVFSNAGFANPNAVPYNNPARGKSIKETKSPGMQTETPQCEVNSMLLLRMLLVCHLYLYELKDNAVTLI